MTQNSITNSQNSQFLYDHATQEVPEHQKTLPISPQKNPLVLGRFVSLDSTVPHIDLVGPSHSFGRSPQANTMLDDSLISVIHARVKSRTNNKKEPVIFLEDCSLNGTFVNQRKIGKNQSVLLHNGDEVSFSSSRRFSYIFHSTAGDGTCRANADISAELSTHYDIQSTPIGVGSFSKVKLGCCKQSGERCAIKIIDKRRYWSNMGSHVLCEVELLQTLRHPNIISILDCIDSERYFYIVLELVSGGDLFSYILDQGRFSEDAARPLFKQILSALFYLHHNNITHRDLKPENVLLEAGTEGFNLKLSDFGLAQFIGERELLTSACGTPQYAPPEVLERNKTGDTLHSFAGKPIDMWGAGIILYIMLAGEPPFQCSSSNPLALFESIKQGLTHFPSRQPFWSSVSNQAKALLQQLLHPVPSSRPSAEQALKDPWILHCPEKREIINLITPLSLKQKKRLCSSRLHTPIKYPSRFPVDSLTDDDENNGDDSFSLLNYNIKLDFDSVADSQSSQVLLEPLNKKAKRNHHVK